ncbi:MAG: Glu-tRNA(Gln) amidotransferase subunit GatE [Methanomicrobiales archaeon]|nr:Glu-tRNA(Gln) amidotransferase subunit GatE [Methanomicrobiales archaeon]
MDYERLGLKAGIEIHQQLNTREKLFCHCPTVLRTFDERSGEFFRFLRATESELGEIDEAAKEEMKQERRFCYYAYVTTCLVEYDEEPPAPLNPEALEICCTIARTLSMTPIGQVHTMRKLVIDGSNTSGFQRTALVALDGVLPNGGSIETICLEEEAAQRVEGDTFSLDRLGIPLVEITTSPCMKTPEEVREIAAYLGMVLRSTGRVKRGLGTIRQDVNISIRDGARVEIKGVQELDLIAEVVRREVLRQQNLLSIRDQLRDRGASVMQEPEDVTGIFRDTKSSILKKAHSVLAVRLPGFAGLAGREIQPGRRLGSEFADYARKCGVGGIFHTDELPAYGITAEEVGQLRAMLRAGGDECIVLVAADEKKARCAAQQVVIRAGWALRGIPEETRKMLEEGSTAYMRPLPGAARMYPETDVFPVTITADWYSSLPLPELLTTKRDRFVRELRLDPALAAQLVSSEQVGLFEKMVDAGISPSLAARTLLSTLKELSRSGTDVRYLSDEAIMEVLSAVEGGEAAKEAIPAILGMVASGTTVAEALRKCAPALSRDELREIVRRIVEDRRDFIAERGIGALGPLMGVVMAEVRGSVDGKLVSEVLKQEIAAQVQENGNRNGKKV